MSIYNASDIVKLTGPVKLATTAMYAESHPAMSVIASLQAKFLKQLQLCNDFLSLVFELSKMRGSDLFSYNTWTPKVL